MLRKLLKIVPIIILVLAAWLCGPSLKGYIVREQERVDDKSKIMAMGYYRPNFAYFAGIVAGTERPSAELMRGYHFGKPYIFDDYYGMVTENFPNQDAGHALAAFTAYYKGELAKARLHYERAIEINPHFFWPYYNLGVIYYEQKEYAKAANVLTKSLVLNQGMSLGILHEDPFYRQILKSVPDPQRVVEEDLSQGMVDAALLLAVCYLKAGAREQARTIVASFDQPGVWHRELWDQLKKVMLGQNTFTEGLDRMVHEQVPVRLF